MSNDDNFSAGINKIVAYTVVEVLLGLKLAEGDWEKRMFDNWWWSPKAHTNEKASPSAEEIVGTYINPGYPAFRRLPSTPVSVNTWPRSRPGPRTHSASTGRSTMRCSNPSLWRTCSLPTRKDACSTGSRPSSTLRSA
jgi:hypothetical protein